MTVSDQGGFALRSWCHIQGDMSVHVWQDLADPAHPLRAGPSGTSVHAARTESCQKHRRHPSGALTFANGAAPPSLLAFRSQSYVMTFSAAPCQCLPLPITHGCSTPAAARGVPSSPAGWQWAGAMLHCDRPPSWLSEPQEPPNTSQGSESLPWGAGGALGFPESLLTCSRAVPARSENRSLISAQNSSFDERPP